jgi:hypothetical protein
MTLWSKAADGAQNILFPYMNLLGNARYSPHSLKPFA